MLLIDHSTRSCNTLPCCLGSRCLWYGWLAAHWSYSQRQREQLYPPPTALPSGSDETSSLVMKSCSIHSVHPWEVRMEEGPTSSWLSEGMLMVWRRYWTAANDDWCGTWGVGWSGKHLSQQTLRRKYCFSV